MNARLWAVLRTLMFLALVVEAGAALMGDRVVLTLSAGVGLALVAITQAMPPRARD